MNVEVLLQVGFGSKNVGFVTLNHKNVTDVDCKNNKATLYLLLEYNRMHSARGEVRGGQKFAKLGKPKMGALLEPINNML